MKKKNINKLQTVEHKIYNFDTENVWKGIGALQSGTSTMKSILLLSGLLFLSIWFSLKLVVITFLCLSGLSFLYHLIKYLYHQNKWLQQFKPNEKD